MIERQEYERFSACVPELLMETVEWFSEREYKEKEGIPEKKLE